MFYLEMETGEVKSLTEDKVELFNALIGAIANEDSEFVELILEDDPILALAFDDDGYTGLSHAADIHNEAGAAIVQVLMNYGANPYAEDNRGFTPIDDINRIMDQALKERFCAAMGIDIDTAAIIDHLNDVKAERIATERVEARWAAKKAEEDSDTSVEEAITKMDDLLRDPKIAKIEKTIVKAVFETTAPDSIAAFESFYSKRPLEKVNVDDLVKDLYKTEAQDDSIIFKLYNSVINWLGIEDNGNVKGTILLGFEIMMEYGMGASNIHYAGMPHRGFSDDFGDYEPIGGNSVMFENPNLPEADYKLVTILGDVIVLAKNNITDQSQDL